VGLNHHQGRPAKHRHWPEATVSSNQLCADCCCCVSAGYDRVQVAVRQGSLTYSKHSTPTNATAGSSQGWVRDPSYPHVLQHDS
jgi:hypothetical protein